jgi:hypothetical protein
MRVETEYDLSPRLGRGLAALAAVCGAVFLIGAVVDPRHAWVGYLVGFVFATGLALAGVVFLALLNASSAKWAAALRRVPDAMSRAIPVAGAAGLVLLFGVPTLYEWAHESAVRGNPVLEDKSVFLNPVFFAARLVAYFVLWTWTAKRLRDAAPGAGRVARSAFFTAVFAVTFSLASVDWLESLAPEWSSTMFGLVSLSGLALSGVAAATVIAVHLRRAGAWRDVLTDDHLHDLGKLLFAFSMFWAYIWYCQYMLVWYTNMPEETAWYAERREGMWGTLSTIALVLNGLVPFVALLMRGARRSEKTLLRVAMVVLVGRALDLFVIVGPALEAKAPQATALSGTPASPGFVVWEIAPVVGFLALFGLVTLRALARGPAVRASEPGLDYSLHYHA